jgi:hypothetical protein
MSMSKSMITVMDEYHSHSLDLDLDLWFAAATVCLARVGLRAHDSLFDFHDKSNRGIDDESRKDDGTNNARGHCTGWLWGFNVFNCHCGLVEVWRLDRSGVIVNITGKTNQVKDNSGDKHANVVLEGSKKLEDTTEGGDAIKSGSNASKDTNANLASGDKIIVANLAKVIGANAGSDGDKDAHDDIDNNVDNGNDDDCAAVIAAASACDSSRMRRYRSQIIVCVRVSLNWLQ